MKRLKNIAINIYVSIMATIVILVILEILLRTFAHQDIYTVSSYPKAIFDKNSITTLKPNFQGAFLSSEIKGNIKINSKGLRDYEREYNKNNKYRILGLGDSFAFGHGIEFENSFLTILENNLQNKISKDIQIIKAGVPGQGLTFYLKLLKKEGIKYSPDMVLINFFIGNDIKDITLPKNVYQILVEKDNQSTNKKDINSLKTWLRRNIHLYSFIVDKLKSIPKIRRALNKTGVASGLIGRYALDILKKDYSKEYIEKWTEAEKILKQIKEIHPNTVLVIIPSREQVDHNRLLQAVKQLDYDINEIDKLHPNNQLEKICSKLQIELITLTPEFINIYEKGKSSLYFEIDPHLNEDGHKLAAKIIYDKIINAIKNAFPLKRE